MLETFLIRVGSTFGLISIGCLVLLADFAYAWFDTEPTARSLFLVPFVALMALSWNAGVLIAIVTRKH